MATQIEQMELLLEKMQKELAMSRADNSRLR